MYSSTINQVCGPSFPNDRQADQQMAEFDRLTTGFVVDGYDLSGALRYPFFIDCLSTNNYSHYSRLQRLFIPTAWKYQYQPADVLFVQEGNSERENEQISSMFNWLASHNCSAGIMSLSSIERWQRLKVSIETRLRQGSWMCGLEKCLDRVDDMATTLMKSFGLSEKLRDWLSMHAALALCRYKKALSILEGARTKPGAVVVSSEYHPVSRAMVSAAHKLGIPTILVQHGFLGQEWLYWPISSEKVCLWGEVDKRWYLNREFSQDRIEVTGSGRAFSIDPAHRISARKKYGIQDDERVIVFFSPNLTRQYHVRAAEFLNAARSDPGLAARWFVRPHPSQSLNGHSHEYRGFETIPASVPLKEVFAVADLALHDYSTMAFAQFAGLKTACLTLDPPYPEYYPTLLGDQMLVTSVESVRDIIRAINPSYSLMNSPTATMAAGGDEALERIGHVILDVVSNGRLHV